MLNMNTLFLQKLYVYRYLAYRYQKWSVERNPMSEIRRNYIPRFGKEPDLDNPHNLIEKIYWMQLHCDTTLWTQCADKYRMRDYVKQCGCEKYLPQIYGVWDNPDDIKWEDLPNQFVLKANNGCGTVLVIKDKTKYDYKKTIRLMKQWIAIPYGYRGYQPHYLKIKPCIMAEELLTQNEEYNRFSTSIIDFKLWCFNGHVESVLVTSNRTKESLNLDLYDLNWSRLSQYVRTNGMDRFDPNLIIPRPNCWDEMKQIASKLSEGLPQMRVDFYVVDNKPVIGELTMATGYGYFTEEYYNHLGELTDVTLMKRIK